VEISDTAIQQAEQRMSQRMASTPRALAARYDRRVARIMVTLTNGLELAFPPHLAEGLAGAKPADLALIEITPTGLGLHWPRLDADLYVPSLLEGTFGSPRWMAALRTKSSAPAPIKGKPAGSRTISRRSANQRKLATS
jgi:hypothetical protein